MRASDLADKKRDFGRCEQQGKKVYKRLFTKIHRNVVTNYKWLVTAGTEGLSMATQAQTIYTPVFKKPKIYGGKAEHPECRMRGQAQRTISHYKWTYFS